MSIPMNIQGQKQQEAEQTVTVLTDEQIWELIENTRFARLGTVDEDGYVHITPLNIVTDGVRIFFRTAKGSKLTQLILNDKVTLQFDRAEGHQAHSVNVFATARVLTDTRDIDYVTKLNLAPWLDTEKLEFVELTPHQLTGRRFRLG
ncbi:pyridoxamine 5'-phosphate oxidase family protein [Rothia nasimurium]|uniref:pyridoxamine 5'-phosphate oxidase family protein n=1 Tax=Rothia nasimurium TaxID=85336 RepID=UPI003B9E78C8